MDYELIRHYLEKAKWCLKYSSEPIIATMAYIRCIEDIFNNIDEHSEKCVCGGTIYYVVTSGGNYLQCSCCDWMLKA